MLLFASNPDAEAATNNGLLPKAAPRVKVRGRVGGGLLISLYGRGGGEGGGVLGSGGRRERREGEGGWVGEGGRGRARSIQRRHRRISPLESSIACVGFWTILLSWADSFA